MLSAHFTVSLPWMHYTLDGMHGGTIWKPRKGNNSRQIRNEQPNLNQICTEFTFSPNFAIAQPEVNTPRNIEMNSDRQSSWRTSLPLAPGLGKRTLNAQREWGNLPPTFLLLFLFSCAAVPRSSGPGGRCTNWNQ